MLKPKVKKSKLSNNIHDSTSLDSNPKQWNDRCQESIPKYQTIYATHFKPTMNKEKYNKNCSKTKHKNQFLREETIFDNWHRQRKKWLGEKYLTQNKTICPPILGEKIEGNN